jgi:hypothetical protein
VTVRFYGQAPSRRGRPDRVAFLGGPCGELLSELAGRPLRELHDLIEFRNLLDAYPGARDGKGDGFPLDAARLEADLAMEPWEDGDVVVFAGRAVADAFDHHAPWLAWEVIEPGVRIAVFPHPSRTSQYWNDPVRVEAARTFLRRLVQDAERLRALTATPTS